MLTAPDGAYAGGGHGGGPGGSHGARGFHGRIGIHHHRGARLNIGPLATRKRVIARNIGPLAGRHLAGRHHGHHHHHGNDGTLFLGGVPIVTDPLVLTADAADIAGFPDTVPEQPHVAHPVIRTLAESQQVCTAQYVKVPSSQGAETTVTIIRC
jgi:hypothetical protein